ncbi:Cell division protein FtsI [Peptidoglycan synthetase] [Microbacterium esteraromaticum]|uniref:Cell division protein FtsI [Peptidoglycan synthetase] n=1 Tax=Microbacterium esteraromaticum TaxID=57043 RepID=A0A1R4IIP8_9MICO|nr:penicillin-binding protein 2 [Microbacterium esteraromaticum]SJN19504.1 Cell division protein FtsI [Peptidoglycan synthetase] [Microbacterium esteraromaticum]
MTTRAARGPRRRTVAALGVILIVLSAFVFRLVDIQVVHADDHVAESLGPLGVTKSVAGARGDIVDTNGTVLASSVFVYDAQLDPQLIAQYEKETDPKKKPKLSWEEASEQIADIVDMPVDDVREIVRSALAADENSQYAELAKGLSTAQYLAMRDLKVAYLYQRPRSVRVYPNGAVAGNTVGFLNGAGEPQYGIERMQDKCLAATDGETTYLRGNGGVTIPGSERTTPAIDGGQVTLTINSDLNWYLQQMVAEEVHRQGAKAGSVTVVEVKTGKIRAAAEYPALDPNDINAVDSTYWRSQIFSTTFEPGSTFKAVTAATVIDSGKATPLTNVVAPSREHFPNGAVINDPFPHPVYNYTFAGALIDSSNVALSKFGTKVSPQTRVDYLHRFGVGDKTAVGFFGEESGGVRDPKTWDNQTLYTTTFGQAYTVTTAQLAAAYQALGNDGEKIDLSLVESCTDADGTVHEPKAPDRTQVVKKETAEQVQRMLENVAVQGGLADTVRVPGYRIGIKTGTAQKPDGHGGYKSGIYFTSIVGVAPIDDPQFVVVVTLDEPTKIRSSSATAPGLQKAMTQVLKTYRVAPSSEPMGELLPKFD